MTASASSEFAALVEAILRREGLSPHSGRILGHLMMSGNPVAFSDLARELDISRGSVSQNTAQLQSVGLVERVDVPGSRAVAFRFRDDAWAALAAGAVDRMDENTRAIRRASERSDLNSVQAARIADMIAFQDLTRAALARVAGALADPARKTGR